LRLIAGYPRSGTTMLYQWACECNRDKIILYEPDHELLPVHLRRADRIVDITQPRPHMPWKNYLLLPESVREEIIRSHVVNSSPMSLDEIRGYVDVLAKIAREYGVVYKVVRWSMVLGELAREYNARVLFIIRDVYDVVMSHMTRLKGNEDAFNNLKIYERIRREYGVEARDIVERVTVNWFFHNTRALEDSVRYPKNIAVVHYSRVVSNPVILRHYEPFIGLNLTCNPTVYPKKYRVPVEVKVKIDSVLKKLCHDYESPLC